VKAGTWIVAAVLAAGLGLFFLWRMGERAGPAGPRSVTTPHAAEGALEAARTAKPPRDSAAPSLERRSVDLSDATGGDLAPVDRDRDLHGIVLDPGGRPLAGATVAVIRKPGEEFHLLDPEHGRERRLVAAAETRAGGRFAFPLEPGRPYELRVDAQGYPRFQSPHRYAGEYVEVRLQRGAGLFGWVTRPDDSAVVGARVELRPRVKEGEVRTRDGLLVAVTDVNGAYRFEAAPPGPYLLDVLPERDAAPRAAELDLLEGRDLEQNVVVVAGVDVRGRVTGAAGGRPIAGAEVGEGWRYERSTFTDANGEYLLPGFSPGHADLRVRAEGYGEAQRRIRPPSGEIFPRQDFVLHRGRRACGRVLDVAGEPIEGAYVAGCASFHVDPDGQITDWRSAATGADGAFELTDLRAEVEHTLLAKKDGHGAVVYQFPDDEREHDVVELGDVVLPPAALARGTLVDEDDRPRADQLVTLRGHNSDRMRFASRPRAQQWSLDGYVARRTARTDDLGRFAFTDLAPGEYTLEARATGVHEASELAFEVAAGEVREDLRLLVPRGLAIEGRIRVDDGGAIPKVYVSVDPEQGGTPADVEADADGSFRAGGIELGVYRLTAYPYATEDDRRAGRRFASARRSGVPAGAREVEILLKRALDVTGRVVDAGGDPVGSAWVEARDVNGELVNESATDGDGRFSFAVAANAELEVIARPPRAIGAGGEAVEPDPATTARARGVRPGVEPLELRLPWRP